MADKDIKQKILRDYKRAMRFEASKTERVSFRMEEGFTNFIKLVSNKHNLGSRSRVLHTLLSKAKILYENGIDIWNTEQFKKLMDI